jgi:uncharacterized protein (DUF433 family)
MATSEGYIVSGERLIAQDLEIMGGVPCFAGTRVPVKTVLDCLDSGAMFEEVLKAYPFLTAPHVEAARAFAKQLPDAVGQQPRWVPAAFAKAARRN